MAKDVMVLSIKNFPLDLYARIKKQAVKERRTLKGLIIVALEEYLFLKEELPGLVVSYCKDLAAILAIMWLAT